MGQFLRLIIILFGVWIVLRLLKRNLLERPGPTSSSPSSPSADMLRCEYCGMFVPRGEAVVARGHAYCSGDHADRDHH
jgi:uncharacterized protein